LANAPLFDPTLLYIVGATEFAIPALQICDQRPSRHFFRKQTGGKMNRERDPKEQIIEIL
jgi:hypothetical protein